MEEPVGPDKDTQHGDYLLGSAGADALSKGGVLPSRDKQMTDALMLRPRLYNTMQMEVDLSVSPHGLAVRSHQSPERRGQERNEERCRPLEGEEESH
ncbi:hypothetical protein EYF80_004704 [Liparis tanakae]|uniref:Uncharacterized protein n=1 Tax=Liparis tanakae TaxID=230148 RepID=A0A4Z2J4E0_9TELE|nr:hypothetical protein EYF80_004704 [Liparis tanakae]